MMSAVVSGCLAMHAARFTRAERAALRAALDADARFLGAGELALIERYYAAFPASDPVAPGMLAAAQSHRELLEIAGGSP